MRHVWAFIFTLVCSLVSAASAAGQEWVVVGVDGDGNRFELDVSSVVLNGDVALGWVQQTNRRPLRMPAGTGNYLSLLTTQHFNCANGQGAIAAAVYRDNRGMTLANLNESPPFAWQSVAPGSVGAALNRAACAIAKGETVGDVRRGDWRSAGGGGTSPANSYSLSVLMDDIVEVAPGIISVLSRSDYGQYQAVDGVPFRYIVDENLVNCRTRELAIIGSTFLVTPTRVVREQSTPVAQVKPTPIAPGSIAQTAFGPVCSAPTRAEGPGGAGSGGSGGGGIGFGTAWATDKGYLVTASHVIEDAAEILLFQDGVRVGSARVVVDDPANDVAVLRYTPERPGPLTIIPLSRDPPALGRSVFTMGYPAPQVMGQRVKLTTGVISSTAGAGNDVREVQISIPIQGGNSGGPLVAANGQAMGVIASSLVSFDGGDDPSNRPELVNYAVKAAYVRPLIDDLPDLGGYTPVEASADMEQLAERLRPAVFMVVARKQP